VDVAYRLDPTLPKTRAVEAAIRTAIADGLLAVGDRLPSSRDLAAELGVARNTVVAAVDDLIVEGVLEPTPRSGVFVGRNTHHPSPVEAGPEQAEPIFDFRVGRPERGSFPASRWIAATRRAVTHLVDAPSRVAGAVELRTQLAAYLGRARGVETTAECIIICPGYHTAAMLLATAFAKRGARTVAIEDPSLPDACEPWLNAGYEIVDLPVDDDGAQVERLTTMTDVVILTPSHQFPMGAALSPRRRQLVSTWANTTGAYIIEDDYDGEFRFDRQPIAALQRSAPHQIVYAGTTSKSLDPGLRLSWLALPPELVTPVAETAAALTAGAPLLNQLALADLIATGEYERHIRRQRREYARRLTQVHETLHQLGIRTPGISAGLQTLITSPAASYTDLSAETLAAHGIAAPDLNRYTRTARYDAAIVLGFAAPSRAMFQPSLAALARACADPHSARVGRTRPEPEPRP
jgi:GntR family transcriptional regulator/MocR family aminotransferase